MASKKQRNKKYTPKKVGAWWGGLIAPYEPRLPDERADTAETQLLMFKRALSFGFFTVDQLESLAAYARVILQAAVEVNDKQAADKAQALWMVYKAIAARKERAGKFGIDHLERTVLWDAIDWASGWARNQSVGTIDRAIGVVNYHIKFEANATVAGKEMA